MFCFCSYASYIGVISIDIGMNQYAIKNHNIDHSGVYFVT